MKIVIDIDDNEYTEIKEDAETFRNKGMTVPYLYKVIESGIPLPKGHGDLIEREKLLEQADEIVTYCRQQEVDYDVIFVSDVEDAPAIIKADKDGE